MRRRRPQDEHQNHEAWAIPYGDLVTLLLAFFVVMYSISSVNEGKYRVISDSLNAAFRGEPTTTAPVQVGKPATTTVASPVVKVEDNVRTMALRQLAKVAEDALSPLIKQGLLGLEPFMDNERDDFMRKGLQLVVDGGEPDSIRTILEVDLETREAADVRAARVFEGMGVYAPTLGIIGAVLGLMAVMQHLTEPALLGAGIAAAFTATVYGIGLANLFLLPIASKLKTTAQALSHQREMVIEGMVAIAQGDNPRLIESRLQGYLH